MVEIMNNKREIFKHSGFTKLKCITTSVKDHMSVFSLIKYKKEKAYSFLNELKIRN